MTDIQTRLDNLKQKISVAQNQKTRAEVELEQAEARLMQLNEDLVTRFKVEYGDDAKKLAEKLEASIETKLAQAEKDLQDH